MNITHVGIYAGDGMVVDASSRGEVVYRSLFDSDKQVLYGRPYAQTTAASSGFISPLGWLALHGHLGIRFTDRPGHRRHRHSCRHRSRRRQGHADPRRAGRHDCECHLCNHQLRTM